MTGVPRQRLDEVGVHGRREEGVRPVVSTISTTVSFHNFKSQNFKSSVSNPKSKYVAYLSVRSRISNCQGLGRKNKFEILKTDRSTISTSMKSATISMFSSISIRISIRTSISIVHSGYYVCYCDYYD